MPRACRMVRAGWRWSATLGAHDRAAAARRGAHKGQTGAGATLTSVTLRTHGMVRANDLTMFRARATAPWGTERFHLTYITRRMTVGMVVVPGGGGSGVHCAGRPPRIAAKASKLKDG